MTPVQFLLKVWGLQAQVGAYYCVSVRSVASDRWKDIFFRWPIKKEKLSGLFKRYPDTDYHLYFGPMPFREPLRRRELVIGSRLLWADLDDAQPRACDPVPQIAWESSPNRHSSLWILNQFHTPLEIEPANRNMTYGANADKAGWDLTQVLRIPGLRNCKYANKPKSKLLWFTDNQYSIDAIPEAVRSLDPKETLKKFKRRIKKGTLKLLLAKKATVGKRSEVIWRLQNELHEQGLNRDEIFTLIKHSVWNKFAGRKDEDRQLRRELDKVEVKHERTTKLREKDKSESEEKEEKKSKLIRLSDVEPETVKWLWYPYIPVGKVTIIEGDPGLGKTWLTMALASYISQKKKLPGQERPIVGNVIIMSAEDGIGDTIVPRLIALRGNRNRIFAHPDPLTLDEDGMEEMDEFIKVHNPKLVIIDPLVAYMGAGVDLHKANETREMMKYLAHMAEKNQVAIVAIRHLRKGTADKSIYRGIGSIDLTAAARSVMMMGRDPNDSDFRVLCHIKSNLAPTGHSLRFEIRNGSMHPFHWAGTTDLTAKDVLGADGDGASGKSEREMAIEFLKELLQNEPVLSEHVKRDAESKGISKAALLKAKRQMKLRMMDRDGKIYWALSQESRR